ncbi:MAG: carbon storage regulator [Planctomycetaceae bacterium]
MLVLSRKIREQIDFPELGIRLTVLSVGTNRVQVGIDAPDHVRITRPDAVKVLECVFNGRSDRSDLLVGSAGADA